MAWARNGTPHTLGSDGDELSITDLTAYKFNVFLTHVFANGSLRTRHIFNNDSGTNYSYRYSQNGATDVTSTSQTNMGNNQVTPAADSLIVHHCCSISGEEKLVVGWTSNANTAGASNAPGRLERTAKYVPSPDADVTQSKYYNDHSGDYVTGSNQTAIGTD